MIPVRNVLHERDVYPLATGKASWTQNVCASSGVCASTVVGPSQVTRQNFLHRLIGFLFVCLILFVILMGSWPYSSVSCLVIVLVVWHREAATGLVGSHMTPNRPIVYIYIVATKWNQKQLIPWELHILHIVHDILTLQSLYFCLYSRYLLSRSLNALHFILNQLFMPYLAYRNIFVMLRYKPVMLQSRNAIKNLILRTFYAKSLLESIFYPPISHISKQALSGWSSDIARVCVVLQNLRIS